MPAPNIVNRLATLFMPVVAAALIMLLPTSASAHDAGVTDTGITILRDSIQLVYTVPEAHIPEIAGDEYNQPAGESAIKAVLNGFSVSNNGESCASLSHRTNRLEAIKSTQFLFVYDCGGPITKLEVTYRLLFDDDPNHQNFTRISLLQHTQKIILSTDKRTHMIDVESIVRQLADNQNNSPPVSTQLIAGTRYFAVGVEHILQGFDHLLFLVALLLLPLSPGQVLALVTAFTVAHSITLGLSVLNVVSLRPVLVETAIALSVVYMALETFLLLRRGTDRALDKAVTRRRVSLTFAFGLIHGFGFSYLLKELGLGEQFWSSLLFFNLGVEAGQLVAIALYLPVTYLLFKRFPRAIWAMGLALIVGLVGLIWLIERLGSLVSSL